MTDIKALQKRIEELEKIVNSSAFIRDKEFMDAMYEKAVDLVKKYQKSSAIFLQTKLMIDFERAKNLVERLKKEEIIKKV
ncbi:MAG: DNA translocase FtsK [Candidatus Shapirobacteria bacterium]